MKFYTDSCDVTQRQVACSGGKCIELLISATEGNSYNKTK